MGAWRDTLTDVRQWVRSSWHRPKGRTSSFRDPLTEEDIAEFTLRETLVNNIEKCRTRYGLKKSEFKVLDWGCGRGRSVLSLREKGYVAFGVDINSVAIDNAKRLFEDRGYDALRLLRPIQNNGRTSFPDEFFHFVFSEQVFEHVEDLDKLATEINRISLAVAAGCHSYPAHKAPVEGHLLMPFVHWLPKNRIRKFYILLLVLLGFGPDFSTTRGKGVLEKAEIYYRGNVTTSFYRHYRVVQRCLQAHGFDVEFISIKNAKLLRIPGFRLATRIVPLRWVINKILLTFLGVALVTTKKGRGADGNPR